MRKSETDMDRERKRERETEKQTNNERDMARQREKDSNAHPVSKSVDLDEKTAVHEGGRGGVEGGGGVTNKSTHTKN